MVVADSSVTCRGKLVLAIWLTGPVRLTYRERSMKSADQTIL